MEIQMQELDITHKFPLTVGAWETGRRLILHIWLCIVEIKSLAMILSHFSSVLIILASHFCVTFRGM